MELQIQWDHPVPPKPKVDPHSTFAIPRRALPLEEALAVIRGNDPRPLLVVRECVRCTGTEDALLKRMEDNERTFLMSRWFHCVKLPPAVIEPEHAFHNLFAGEKPSHLFISRADGSLRHDLSGVHSQVELWRTMRTMLASEYSGDPDKALLKLAKILDSFDELDQRILDLQRRVERAAEKPGTGREDLAKLKTELAEQCARRNKLREDAVRVSTLRPLNPEPRANAPG